MRIPPPPPNLAPDVLTYLRNLHITLSQEFLQRVPDRTARDSVLLVSPNGTVYTVRVNDAGVLSTTVVPLGSRE